MNDKHINILNELIKKFDRKIPATKKINVNRKKMIPGDIICHRNHYGKEYHYAHYMVYHGNGRAGNSQLGEYQQGIREKKLYTFNIHCAYIYRHRSDIIRENMWKISERFSIISGGSNNIKKYTKNRHGDLPTPYNDERTLYHGNDILVRNLILGYKILKRAYANLQEVDGIKFRVLSKKKGVHCSMYVRYVLYGAYMLYILEEYENSLFCKYIVKNITDKSVKSTMVKLGSNGRDQVKRCFKLLCNQYKNNLMLLQAEELFGNHDPKMSIFKKNIFQNNKIWEYKKKTGNKILNEDTILITTANDFEKPKQYNSNTKSNLTWDDLNFSG
ncbi:MAG: hypothetical protein AAGA27_03510 [Pseudomonadota bacterium]